MGRNCRLPWYKFIKQAKLDRIELDIWDTVNKLEYLEKSVQGEIEFPQYPEDSEIRYSLKKTYDPDILKKAMEEYKAFQNAGKLSDALNGLAEQTFVDYLLDQITSRNLRPSSVYKAAQIDRRLYSKIISDRFYQPSRDTAISLAIALELSPAQVADFLQRAGYTLSHSSKRDIVIEYFVVNRLYDLPMVNSILYKLGLPLLGR